jgi:hypothetical protein
MADDKPSTEVRVYAAADALLLEYGSLDAVTLAEVVRRAGGRKQNVARFLNRWRIDRTMMAAGVPDAVLRLAFKFARDLFLILVLDDTARARAADGAVTAPVHSEDVKPAQARASRSLPAHRGRGATASGPARRTAVSEPAPGAGAAPGADLPAAEPVRRSGFLQGHQARVAASKSRPAVNARPPDAPGRRPSPSHPGRRAGPKRAGPKRSGPAPVRPPRRESRPPETPAAKAARLARIRDQVMRARAEREAANPPVPVVEADWAGASAQKVARAVAIALRRARRPMTAKALIDGGKIPLKTHRPSRDLPAALAGSPITRVADRGGAFWFDYEPPPPPKKLWLSDDTEAKLAREFGRLMWVRLVVAIAVSPSPLKRSEIAAALEPELSDLSPVWLAQCLKRGKQQGAFATRDGGYVMARPRKAAGDKGRDARASAPASGGRL